LLADFLPVIAAEAPATVAPAQLFAGQPVAERIHVAQQRKRRTLMDLLFGDDSPPETEAPPVEQPVKRKPKPQAALPPPKPEVTKAEGATRLAVFGDSMAVDLTKALERMFAEDPNIVVIGQGVGSSGFVRPDFFDWDKTIGEQIAANSFDVAVVILGINDRQTMNYGGNSYKSLTVEWSAEYSARVSSFVTQLRNAGKPTIWVGLPPMEAPSYNKAIAGINELQKLAVFSAGAEFLDITERFLNEEGKYSAFGPDLNGNRVRMRKDDGIHFSAAGADKLAFFLNQTLKLYYRGGGVGIEVADALAGTDAQLMVRPPYQGLGQMTLLEVAGAVISLTHQQRRAMDLVTPGTASIAPVAFDMSQLIDAPAGRVDAFGVGRQAHGGVHNPGGR
ncbi:MAG TPA: SGNH family hydrolase, partial [Devosia sp.]|nr:SGNH family hydrolase [Devosia sp.]